MIQGHGVVFEKEHGCIEHRSGNRTELVYKATFIGRDLNGEVYGKCRAPWMLSKCEHWRTEQSDLVPWRVQVLRNRRTSEKS